MEKEKINKLITEAGKGSEEAMTELYNGIGKVLYSYILTLIPDRGNAEDILQETFLKIYTKPKVLSDTDNGLAFMFTIAHNLCINFILKNKRSVASSDEEIDVFGGSKLTDFESALLADEYLKLLSEQEKKIFLLSELYGFTYDEIAKMIKVSTITVKRRMKSIKEKFANIDTLE